MITSNQNPKIKLVRALQARARDRREAGVFVIEGVRLVEEALAAKWPFRYALHGESLSARGRRLVAELVEAGVETEFVSDALIQSVSATEHSQGILAVLHLPESPNPNLAIPEKPDFILILDAIRDPGNLGSLLRTASAAGVQAVFLTPETTDAFAPKVVRAGMGTHFYLPIHALGWEAIRKKVKGLKVYLADAKGEVSCWQADLSLPLALVIGGEAQGASGPARKLADVGVRIPMHGQVESLNAAGAGAILIFEVVRQRSTRRG